MTLKEPNPVRPAFFESHVHKNIRDWWKGQSKGKTKQKTIAKIKRKERWEEARKERRKKWWEDETWRKLEHNMEGKTKETTRGTYTKGNIERKIKRKMRERTARRKDKGKGRRNGRVKTIERKIPKQRSCQSTAPKLRSAMEPVLKSKVQVQLANKNLSRTKCSKPITSGPYPGVLWM